METKKCTKLRFFALGVAFWCFCLMTFAQSVNVKGTVVDSHGESIIGASVVQKGNPSVGTVSDLEGNFQLKITGKNPVIVVSYVGMRATEVKVVSGKPVKVTLEEDNAALEEVVVVGYGQQKKASLVGSITQTSGKVLERTGGVSDLGSALTGNLPGVITTSSSGMPGNEKVNIVIRGVSSWNGSSPLILVDGIERKMEDVDIQSVANISVLKDASATAVYGVKGANGVILITTKRGSEGKAKIGFNFSSTMKFVSKLPQTLGSAASLRARNEVIKHELGLKPESWAKICSTDFISKYENQPEGAIDPETGFLMSERYPDVDWQKELFKDMAMSYNANVNISGGTRFVKYFASIDFQHEGDLFREWDNGRGYKGGYGFNRVNVRSNLDFQLTKTTTFKAGIFGSQGIRNTPWGIADGEWTATQLWQAAYSAPHNAFVPRYSDGTWGYYPQETQGAPNSVTNLALAGAEQRINTVLNTDFTLSQDLSFITKGLKFNGTISWDNSFSEQQRGVNDLYHDAQFKWIDPVTGEVTYSKLASSHTKFDFTETRAWSTQGSQIMDWMTYKKLYYQMQLVWGRKFGKHDEHDVTAMGVFSREERSTGSEFSHFREDWVFRATYNYGDRYLLEYNGAYNGSEQFGSGYRFAFNNSVAAGWTLSNEKFMRSVADYKLFGKKLIDILKFRFSYGEVGNDNVGGQRWLYATQWSYAGASHIDPKSPDDQQALYTWYKEKSIGNPNVRWETAKKRNFGIDYAFLDGLVAGSLEFFHENRYDILIYGDQRSVPFYYGAKAPAVNFGRTKTTGYELELRLKHSFKNGIYAYGNFSMTHAVNNIQVYDDPGLYPAYRKQAGYAIGQAHSYIDNGIAQTWDDVIAMTEHKTNDDQKLPGQYFITDFDGNGVIDEDDNIPYGFTGTPQNTYNATLGAEYKGWSIMVQFYGATNVTREVAFNSFSKSTLDVVFDEGSFWNPESGAGIPTPRYNSTPNYYAGTRFMYDGSFCRLKNMEIGYTWTKGWVKSLGLNNLKLYVNGNNLLLWTKMPDDRESNFATTGGNGSLGAYPTMKRINFGVKFEL